LATVWVGLVGPRSVAGLFHVISIIMDHLDAQYGVFIVEAHFKNGYSVVTTRKTELFFLGT
jgi:hypothetical protein